MTVDMPQARLIAALGLSVLLGACSDSSPAAPGEDVARLDLDQVAVELELRDSLQINAAAFSPSGTLLGNPTITWTSSDRTVATVSDNGLVTGTGAGVATITATADAASAQVRVTVVGYNIAANVAVIDSTALDLLSDSTERSTGTYRFQILQRPAPTFEIGTVMVGTQDLGFLRRVTSVSTAGDVITLQTTQAALSDVIEEGSLDTTIDLIFSAGAPSLIGPVTPGEVRWGAATFTPLVPGATLTAAGIALSNLDICKLLETQGGPGCPSAIKKLEIKTGTLDFGPSFDLSASWSGLSLSSFEGVVDGTVKADFDLVLQAEGSISPIKPQIDIAEITRPFYAMIGPVPIIGYVELGLKGGLEAKATAKGSIEAGFTNTHSVRVGANWSDSGGWSPVFESDRTFDAKLPSLAEGTLSAQIDVETTLFLKPELKIIFYGLVGPFANIEPFGKFTLTFGTAACGMKSEAGINSEIGFTIPFLDSKVGNFSHKNAPWFNWPGRNWDCPLGSLDIAAVTTGASPDTDGYSIVVDSKSKGTVGSNAETSLPFIEVGIRSVTLEGIASNCTVVGDNPREVTVNTATATAVTFEVECADPGGNLTVSLRTTGTNLDPDGYRVLVDRTHSLPVAINGTALFEGMASGDHEVVLDGLAPNCVVVGSNPQTVAVPPGTDVTASFEVTCAATQLVVRTETTGPPASIDWSASVHGGDTQPIGPNDQVTFDLAAGSYQVEILGLPSNCAVDGSNPRTVLLDATEITETFVVNCAGGGISITVTTEGDPAPATSYTAQVDTLTKSIATDGTVDFLDVAEGAHDVLLTDVPAHCLVQGENPRSVDAPGSTNFEVVCEQPTLCLSPPDGHQIQSEVTTDWDASEPMPTMTPTIVKENYGDIEAMSELSNMTGDQSATVFAQVFWDDWWNFIPVDETRLGESAIMKLRVSGLLQREADPDGRSHAYFNAMGFGGLILEIEGGDTATGVVVDEPVEMPITLGTWNGASGWVRATAASNWPGTAPSARVAQQIQVVDVIDTLGRSIPIRQMCTASGTDYR
ncbi:MAG: Ig-like domain-containing protein [Gemmatimonadota bacterium]|nr:Ig-like domain-containing protein [Gemmatimonadota bacterium]